MKSYLLLYCCFGMCLCLDTERQAANGSSFELKVHGDSEVMSGTLQRVVKTYHCAADNIKEQQIILYGTKAWTFPTQDVNLTLRYPSVNSDNSEFFSADEYLITGLLVVLHIDSPRSRGYVTQGGILTERISMTFIIENVSRLSYQFWLYGVSKSYVNTSEYTWQQNLC